MAARRGGGQAEPLSEYYGDLVRVALGEARLSGLRTKQVEVDVEGVPAEAVVLTVLAGGV